MDLLCSAPHLVATEAVKVEKFWQGLNPKIKGQLISHIFNFEDLVATAKSIEHDLKDITEVKVTTCQNCGKRANNNLEKGKFRDVSSQKRIMTASRGLSAPNVRGLTQVSAGVVAQHATAIKNMVISCEIALFLLGVVSHPLGRTNRGSKLRKKYLPCLSTV
ncbi:hypothetical protein FCV25MIE_30531 [Fagus crenata]